jgi:hypothetical protein
MAHPQTATGGNAVNTLNKDLQLGCWVDKGQQELYKTVCSQAMK